MKWLIYKHTLIADCKHKGWSYIGQTCLTTKERWRDDLLSYKTCTLFYRAIKKHGWENFSHEVLEDNILSLEEADKREQYWIAYYHTWVKDKNCQGYNITPGGRENSLQITVHLKTNYEESRKIYKYELAEYEEAGWFYPVTEEERKACRNAYYRKYAREHRQQRTALVKQYRERNSEYCKEQQRIYWTTHPEFRAAYNQRRLEKSKKAKD